VPDGLLSWLGGVLCLPSGDQDVIFGRLIDNVRLKGSGVVLPLISKADYLMSLNGITQFLFSWEISHSDSPKKVGSIPSSYMLCITQQRL
jgi:hypothetical protein